MSLLSRTLWAIRAPRSTYPKWALANAADQRFDMPENTLATAHGELYQRLSWVQIAVTTIANAAAVQPLNVLSRKGDTTKDIDGHPFEELLRRPNPLMSRYDLLYGTVAYRELTGNAYWWLNRPSQTGPPLEVWLIPSNRMKPIPDERLYLKGYEYDAGQGETMMLPTESVCHFKRFHPGNAFVGLSAIEALSTVAVGDMAAQKWNSNFFAKSNAKAAGALVFSDPIPDTEWMRMQTDFARQYGGSERQLMMLRGAGAGGVSWLQMAANQADMEFLSGRQFTKEEIWLAFGLMPGLMDKNATEANASAAKAAMSEYTIWPLLTAMAETISNHVLPAYGDNLVAEFEDPRKADRAMDLAEHQEYAKTHTVNEIRQEIHGDDPLPDDDPRGDMFVVEVAPGVAHSKAEQEAAREQMAADLSGEPEDEEGETPEIEPEPTAEAQESEPTEEPAAKSALDLTELRRWRDKTRRRGKPTDWEPESISADLVAAIKAAQDVLADPSDAFRFIKAVEDSRLDAEGTLTGALGDVLDAWLKRFIRAINGGEEMPWDEFAAALDKALLPEMVSVMTEETLRQSIAVGVGLEVGTVNAAALEWARAYTFDLVKGLTETTRKTVSEATSAFLASPDMTRADLEKLLAGAFGERRASAIAVTEVTRASSQAATHYQSELARVGITMKRIWYTLADERVCPICGPLHNQTEDVWAAQFPMGPPAHPNCVLPGNVVAVPALAGGARSRYVGRAVELTTAGGRRFTVTENHPVLTVRGWIAAKAIGKGDKVFACTDPQRIASSIYPDYDHVPAAIEQVFDTLTKAPGMITTRMEVAAKDLHGDGRFINGDVDVVSPNCLLLRDVQTRPAELVSKPSLDGRSREKAALPRGGTSEQFVVTAPPSSDCIVSGASKSRAFPGGHASHADGVGFRDATARDIALSEDSRDDGTADTVLAGQFLLRHAAVIEPDDIISVRQFDFSGDVYDLQSAVYELYTCNDIVVKNCRCAVVLRA